MNPEIQRIEAAIEEQNTKLDAIYHSVEKTRRAFQMVVWVTIATVAIPLLLLLLAIPALMKSLSAFSAISSF